LFVTFVDILHNRERNETKTSPAKVISAATQADTCVSCLCIVWTTLSSHWSYCVFTTYSCSRAS